MHRFPSALAVAAAVLLTALAAATAPATAAGVRLSFTPAKPVQLAGANGAATQYVTDQTVWLRCRGGATPLAVGWSGPRAPIAMVYSNQLASSRRLGLAVRRPFSGGALRAQALCASGSAVKATVKEAPSGGRSVSCGRGQVAIGVPIDGGPYWAGAVSSRPAGTRGWSVEGFGTYGRAKAICVSARAFPAAQVLTRSARFAAGARMAAVSARCPAGKRAIGWGFEAGAMPGNTWSAAGSSLQMAAPFLAASQPSGTSGWKLTFATPDGAPAAAETQIALHLTCARTG